MLLTKVMHAKDYYNGQMLKSMSELVSALIHLLEKYRSSRPGYQFPGDVLESMFTGIEESICAEGTSLEVRGDLYTAMAGLLSCIKEHRRSDIMEKCIVDYHITTQNSKLLDTLCTDATRGLGTCKTTAYIGTDALNKAALCAGSDVVINHLTEKGVIQHLINTIRSEDAALVKVLQQPDGKVIHSLAAFFL